MTTHHSSQQDPAPAGGPPTEPRPPLGSWAGTYALVLLSAAVCIALLWALTRYAAPPGGD